MNELTVVPPAPDPQEPTFEVLPPQVLPPPPKLRHAHTLANLWHIFINLRGDIRPNTREEWEGIARRFCKFFRNHKLTPEGMSQWMKHLQDFRAPATKVRPARPLNPRHINHYNLRVGVFLKWMRRMNYVHEDLAACLPKLNATARPASRIITEEEYENIKACCKGRECYQPHLWLCVLAYRTGMSLVDCCHLRWRDVHLNEDGPSYIDIHRIKTVRLGAKSLCQIPIIPMSDIHTWLLHLKTIPGYKRFDGVEDYVHRETEGLYTSPMQIISMTFKRIFKHAGVEPGKTFKHFRNALCSNLVNSGMPLPLICKVTGHQDVKTLLGYLKPDRNALEDGMAKAQQYSSATIPGGKTTAGIVLEDEDEDDEDDE